MLRKIRDWYEVFFCIDMVFELGRRGAVVVAGTLAVLLLMVRGAFDEVVPGLVRILGAVAFLGFAAWIYHDAPKALRTIREDRQKQRRDTSTDKV